jgi:hypothetical protein
MRLSQTVTFIADMPVRFASETVEGSFVEIKGERYYRIGGYDAMPPFLMSLVSDSDHWLFISSNGALTAGRKDPDHALFPYYTDDRIHDSLDQTGSKTILRVLQNGHCKLWEPFSDHYQGLYRKSRNLYKSVFGNKIIFEEANRDLGLTFSHEWRFSERFGFVRRASVRNANDESVTVELLDGIQNVLPAGITRRFQLEYSTLVDGYKRTELESASGVALFRLSSIPVDRPEPSESLRVNTAWSTGLDPAIRLLSAKQLGRFRRGCPLVQETDIVGCRGGYFLNARLELQPGEQKDWFIVTEVDQDAAEVRALLETLKAGRDLRAQIEEDVERGTQNLARIVASSDGLQCTADELSTARHFSNTLFNVMRGGLPDEDYRISIADFKRFVAKANSRVAMKHAGFLDALPKTLLHSDFVARASAQGDIDLERIANEYLPLTFSRRHGDPSRPWNMFSINVKDDRKRKVLNYEGNWRDIFQNWEALSLSFPGYVESMIAKFLNSSTADGYNPYRVMREGYEWETVDPHDAWSFIGYWGDHQVAYLLKFLEQSKRFHPERLSAMLTHPVFTYANVPYRIKNYDALLQNPRDTITFDSAAHRDTLRRAEEIGSDGKALWGRDGALVRANLTEKLLVIILTKLSNYIPEAGIWLNTQRPEWNDANNALVGYGASIVTLCYLRRFIAFSKELFQSAGLEKARVAVEVAELFKRISSALCEGATLLDGTLSDRGRKSLLDVLGKAGSDFREGLYEQGLSGAQAEVCKEQLICFCEIALEHIDASIKANRREDGLYHAYNLIKIAGDEIKIRHLYEMLEGQVAALSSGALSVTEAVSVLDALRASSLYRSDQESYLLYPDRHLPHFLEKNNIHEREVKSSALLQELLSRDDRSVVVRDVHGGVHFNAAFRNADILKEALGELKRGELRDIVETGERFVLDLYERVFDHQSFTGRSGTFYKYEGLGSIYWHMVSKLLVAVSALLVESASADPSTLGQLQTHYYSIRKGLGTHKSPQVYGAIPIDPYSHTPKASGAQQPGMTGQVKEDFICRLAEMGLSVEDGRLIFLAQLPSDSEFLRERGIFRFYDGDGTQHEVVLERDSLALTFCGLPIVEHKSGPQRIEVTFADGGTQVVPQLALDSKISSMIFERTGAVRRVDAFLERA